MSTTDIIQAGLNRGWKIHDATLENAPRRFEVDVAIVGTGAGVELPLKFSVPPA